MVTVCICGQVSQDNEVAPLGTRWLCDVLQTFGAGPFSSSHIKEAMDEKAAKIEAMAKEIEADTRKRRARAKRTPSRPSSYRYAGLEKRTTVMMPEGVAAGECDIIGKDVSRILHREPTKVWVEIIERPLLRMKADMDSPNPRIYQAKAPHAVIGGNHVGADMLAQIVIDKYRYHMPEYRLVRQYADLGLKLPPPR